MSQLPQVLRSGIRAEDLTDLDPQIRDALEPLLRYVNNSTQGFVSALTRNVSLSENVRNEVQTVNLSHGAAQLVSLKKLPQAKGCVVRSVGSADGKTLHALKRVDFTGTTNPGQVKVTAYFLDPAAVRVPVTLEFTPEGTYSSLTPKTTPTWTALTLAGTWAVSGTLTPGYYKDANSRIYLRGTAGGGGANNISTLPAGYRPIQDAYFAVDGNGAYGRVKITASTGAVDQDVGSRTTCSLDGISFIAEQ